MICIKRITWFNKCNERNSLIWNKIDIGQMQERWFKMITQNTPQDERKKSRKKSAIKTKYWW